MERACCGPGPLLYSENGTVQHNVTVHLILWGKNFKPVTEGGTTTGEEVHSILKEYFGGLSNSGYQGMLTQYFDPASRVAPEINFPVPEPYVYTETAGEAAPQSVESEKVEHAIKEAIKINNWPVDVNTQFVLVTAPGSTYQHGFIEGFCAYHAFTSPKLVYDFVPYPGDPPFSGDCREDVQGNFVHATSKFASHEYSEAATDPGVSGGWRAHNGAEIGDLCNFNGDKELPGTHAWVQPEYDDHLGGCTYFNDPNPPHVLGLTEPPSNLGRHDATLNATVNAENEKLDTKYRFEYGPTTEYGKSAPVAGSVDVGNELGNQQVHQALTGLPLEATVHYRVTATHIKEGKEETTHGEDHTITPSEWSVGSLPLPGGTGQSSFGNALFSCSFDPISCGGVSCPSPQECVAVGTYESGLELPMAETWNGGPWSVKALPFPEGTGKKVAMTGVSCASTTACLAVGYEENTAGKRVPVAERLNGSEGWSASALSLPEGAVEAGFEGVSCASASECIAVGVSVTSAGARSVPYAALWREGAWTVQKLNFPEVEQAILEGVSCPAASSCIAVGMSQPNGVKFGQEAGVKTTALTEKWNGKAWSVTPAAPPPGGGNFWLFGASCASPKACTAVGTYPAGKGDTSLAERWNGEKWSVQATSDTGHEEDLTGVSCPTPHECTAVGWYFPNGIWVAFVQTWNGSTWRVQALDTDEAQGQASEFHAVSCASTGATCAAVGVTGWSANGSSRSGPVEAFAEIRSAQPSVTSIEPATGRESRGTAVTIKGANFVAPATVTIGNAATSVEVVSESEIRANTAVTAPGTYEVVVSDANGTSSGGATYTYSANAAIYLSTFPSAGDRCCQLGTQGVAVDASGNVWVSDDVNNRVNEFSSQGAFKLAFGWGVKDGEKKLETCTEKCLAGLTGSEPGEFGAPGAYGLSIGGIAASGADIWVVDAGNERIEEFTTGGEYTGTTIGTDLGPEGVAADSSGNLWVSSYGHSALQEFSSTGSEKHHIGTGENLTALAVDAQGNVWAAVSSVGATGFARVDEYSPEAAFKQSFGWHVNRNGAEKLETCTSECQPGTAGSGNGQFNGPHGVAVDGHGDVFVADSVNNRVQEFSATGKYFTQFGSSGSGAGKFSDPLGIAVAGGQAYVVDSENNRVEKWEVWENLPPAVVTGAASSITATTATLNATVNPNGSEVSACKLEYGTTTSYGTSAPCTPSPGSGENPVAVSASVTGLTSGTTYHFRVSATNPGGTSNGSDQTFNTP